MQLLRTATLFALAATQAIAASQWGFTDATVSVSSKGAGVGSGLKEKLTPNKPLSTAVDLGPADTLKLILTTQEGKTAKRPHQAFLSIKSAGGLETSFALSVKETGKGKVDVAHTDIPPQLLAQEGPFIASLIVGSFGSAKPYQSPAFTLNLKVDTAAAQAALAKTERFAQLPEINHIFRADPKSPPKIITLFFTAIVLAALPVLVITWFALGGNFDQLPKAMQASPIGHALYFGSILAMQGIFFLYYTSWNLFQILPPAIAVSGVILFSGSRALTEVQERRLTAQR